LHYITRIITTFDRICGRQKRLRIALDWETVAHVQSRCPGASLNDLRYLERLIDERRIFRAVDDDTRQEIWTRLREVKHLIPTLGSLQQDFKYIRGPAKAVYRLLNAKKSRRQGRRTLRNLAKSVFLMRRSHGKATIQVTDDSTQEIAGSVDDQFEMGFQQLYLFAMRESWNLVGDCPLKEQARKTPSTRSPDPIVWHGFADLAYKLGFESPEIQRLRQANAFEEKARQLLPDSKEWPCEGVPREQLLAHIATLYRTKSPNPPVPRHEPRLLTDGPGERVDRRQGRCYESAYDRDKQHMFLKTLSQPINGCANSVTSLFVRRSVHHAFFPPCRIESEAPVVSEPSGNSGDAGARQQNDDIDMPDAAASNRSSPERDGLDAEPDPEAGLTETLQEGGPSSNRGVGDDLLSTPSTASMVVAKTDLVRKRSTSSSSPGGPLPPAPSSALQLTVFDESGWSRKRPRTTHNSNTVGGQSDDEHTGGSELESGGENQMVISSPSMLLTSGESLREDAHADSSDPRGVAIWKGVDGKYEEVEGIRCTSFQQLKAELQQLLEYDTSDSDGRGLRAEECWKRATSLGGDRRVYVTFSQVW
jgi:hypothetical protein